MLRINASDRDCRRIASALNWFDNQLWDEWPHVIFGFRGCPDALEFEQTFTRIGHIWRMREEEFVPATK